MNILVTGGGGFLGGAIVRKLLERGDTVRSFSRGAYPDLEEQGVECARGDLADADALSRAAQGCDAVFHVAARAGLWGSYRDYYGPNVRGTENVLSACRKHGIRRLVYTSSPSVVFAGRDQVGVDEEEPYPDRFLANYPRTKAEAEQRVLAANSDQLLTVALRPHLIWGPGDPHLVPRVIDRARAGKLRLVGNRQNLVDSTYIENAALAHLLAADRLDSTSPVAGRSYFISQGEPIPMAELLSGILAAADLPPVTRQVPVLLAYAAGMILEGIYSLIGRKEEPPMTRFLARQLSTAHWFDLTAAREDLGYSPSVTLTEGFVRLGHWLRERARSGASAATTATDAPRFERA